MDVSLLPRLRSSAAVKGTTLLPFSAFVPAVPPVVPAALPDALPLPLLFAAALPAARLALACALDCLSAHSPLAMFSFSEVTLLLKACYFSAS